MPKFTTNKLAETLRIEREDAYTLVRFLEAQGLAKRAGAEEPEQKRRGKKQYIYEMSQVTLSNIENLIAQK